MPRYLVWIDRNSLEAPAAYASAHPVARAFVHPPRRRGVTSATIGRLVRVQIENPGRVEDLLRFLRENGHDASKSSPNEVLLNPPTQTGTPYREVVKNSLVTWNRVTQELAWIVPE